MVKWYPVLLQRLIYADQGPNSALHELKVTGKSCSSLARGTSANCTQLWGTLTIRSTGWSNVALYACSLLKFACTGILASSIPPITHLGILDFTG